MGGDAGPEASTATARSVGHWPGYVLGFSLGGFFDGILLHQILQWHHLLSAIDPANARFQVAADGYFHVVMYVVAAIGIWLLWRQAALGSLPGTAGFVADLLIGFGTWQVVDIALAHWMLAIHHVRMDSSNSLLWDLLWLALFGVIPLLAGLILRRGGTADNGRSAVVATVAALLTVGAGAQSRTGSTTRLCAAPLRSQQVDCAASKAWKACGGGHC